MTKAWSIEDETPLRRFSAHGAPYSTHDRYVAAGHPDVPRISTRAYGYASLEEQEVEPESKNNRRRIPVACGRCRKRKIKCSGPLGESSCTNCKNSGSSECQFNRVSSEEVPFRGDSTVEFNYNTELARAVHARACSPATAYRSHNPAYAHGSSLMTTAAPYMYRPEYYPSKYVSMYANGDFGEDALDYAISNNGYSMYGNEHVGSSSAYGSHTATRTWTPLPVPARVCFEPDEATYSQSQVQYTNANFGLRPNLSTEPNNFSFSGMANSLPSPASNTNDRVLPMPAVPRTAPGLTPSRSVDALPYMGPPLRTYHDHPIQMAGPATNPSSYLPLITSPTSADNFVVSNGNGNVAPHHQDVYSIGENWAPPPLAKDPIIRHLDSSSDRIEYYHPNGESPRKLSQSHKSASGGGQSSPSNGNSQQNPYGQETTEPPRNNSADVGRGAVHRRSTGSLHGA